MNCFSLPNHQTEQTTCVIHNHRTATTGAPAAAAAAKATAHRPSHSNHRTGRVTAIWLNLNCSTQFHLTCTERTSRTSAVRAALVRACRVHYYARRVTCTCSTLCRRNNVASQQRCSTHLSYALARVCVWMHFMRSLRACSQIRAAIATQNYGWPPYQSRACRANMLRSFSTKMPPCTKSRSAKVGPGVHKTHADTGKHSSYQSTAAAPNARRKSRRC